MADDGDSVVQGSEDMASEMHSSTSESSEDDDSEEEEELFDVEDIVGMNKSKVRRDISRRFGDNLQ